MALTNEDLQAIAQLLQPIQSDLSEVQSDIKEIKQRVIRIEVSLENETNKNIQLLAENQGNLIDKLNQATKVSDKTTLFHDWKRAGEKVEPAN